MVDLSIETRVALLENCQETMAKNITEIKTNHLPHIEQKLDNLRNWMMGALFTALLSSFILLANMMIGVIGG
jgi:hypothetical protein